MRYETYYVDINGVYRFDKDYGFDQDAAAAAYCDSLGHDAAVEVVAVIDPDERKPRPQFHPGAPTMVRRRGETRGYGVIRPNTATPDPGTLLTGIPADLL